MLFVVIYFLIVLAVSVISVASCWKIFEKAGKPGWACLVPVYSTLVLLEITRKPIMWFVFLCIPFVNIYYGFMLINELSKSFGKGTKFTLGLIFLGFIFLPKLAFSDAEYQWKEEPAFA